MAGPSESVSAGQCLLAPSLQERRCCLLELPPCPVYTAPPHHTISPSWPCLPPAPPLCRLRTGTSQAVPFVAGVVALILENGTDTTPDIMQQLLTANAAQVGGGPMSQPVLLQPAVQWRRRGRRRREKGLQGGEESKGRMPEFQGGRRAVW